MNRIETPVPRIFTSVPPTAPLPHFTSSSRISSTSPRIRTPYSRLHASSLYADGLTRRSPSIQYVTSPQYAAVPHDELKLAPLRIITKPNAIHEMQPTLPPLHAHLASPGFHSMSAPPTSGQMIGNASSPMRHSPSRIHQPMIRSATSSSDGLNRLSDLRQLHDMARELGNQFWLLNRTILAALDSNVASELHRQLVNSCKFLKGQYARMTDSREASNTLAELQCKQRILAWLYQTHSVSH